MSEDKVVSHPHEYYVDLAQRSPKVAPDDWTDTELASKGHIQFGNNFYLLFEARLGAERAVGREEFIRKHAYARVYLIPVETKYENEWEKFLGNNRPLVKQIDTAIDGLSVYQQLNDYTLTLLRAARNSNDYGKAEEIEALNAEGVGIYAWRQLNPLLEQAADRMKDEGIDSHEFFG